MDAVGTWLSSEIIGRMYHTFSCLVSKRATCRICCAEPWRLWERATSLLNFVEPLSLARPAILLCAGNCHPYGSACKRPGAAAKKKDDTGFGRKLLRRVRSARMRGTDLTPLALTQHSAFWSGNQKPCASILIRLGHHLRAMAKRKDDRHDAACFCSLQFLDSLGASYF